MSQMQLLASRRPDSLPVVQPQQQQPQQQQRGTRRRAGSSSREGGDRAEDSGIGSATGDMTPCRRARLSLELNAATAATEKKEAQPDTCQLQQNATFGEDSKSDNNIGISKSNNNNFLFAPSPAADFSGGNQFAIDGYGNGTAATGTRTSTFSSSSSSSSIINKLPLLTNELLKAAEAEEEPEDNGFHTLQQHQQQQKHHRQLQQDPNFRWAMMMSAASAAAASAAGKGEENKKSIGPSSAHQQQRRCMAMALPPPEEPVLENSRLLGSSSAAPSTTIIPPPTSSPPIPSSKISSAKISSAKISYSSSSSKSTTFSSSSSNSSSSTSSTSPRAALLSGSLSCANLARIASGPALASSACCAGSTSDGMPIFSSSCSSSALDQLLQSTEPTQLFDHLFLGSQKDALDVDLLQRRGISRVINLSENCPRAACLPDDARHFLRIPVNDTYSAKLLPHFEAAFQFIEDARKAGERVLLHCLAGISRSPTLAIAYVMRSRGMTNDEAYNFVKSRRPGISPNFNFLGQLWEYERQLRQQHVLPPLPPPASSSFAEKQEEVNAQVEDAATIADTSSPTSLASTFSSIPSSSPPIVVANANRNNGKNKRPKLMMSVEDNNNSSGNMMKAESEQPAATKQQQDQQQQEKPTRPVVRPRQLLGAPNQRLSCPPFLTTELPSPNKSNSNNIPSPSTEFSRLDISLANPCFGLGPVPGPTSMPSRARCQALAPRRKLSPLFSAASMLENPVFGKTLSDGGDWRERLAKSGTPSVESTASSSGVSSASFCSSSADSFCSSLNDSFSSLADENGPAAAFGAAAGNVPFPGPSAAGGQFPETGPSTRNCLADSDGDELVRFGPPPQVRGGYSAFVRQDRGNNTAEDDGTFHAEKRKDGNDDGEEDKVLQACMRAPLPSLERELMLLNSADPFTGMEEFKGIGEEEMDKQHREMQKQQKEMHMQQKEMQKQMRMRMEQVRMKQKVLAEAKKCLGSTRHCMLAKLDLRPNPPPQHAQKRHFHTLLNRCHLPSQRHQQQLVQQQSQQPQQDQPQQPQVHWRGQQQQPSHVQGLMASSSSTSSSSSLSSSRPRLAKSHCIDRLLAFGRKKNLHPGISGAGAHLFRQSLPTIGDDRGREEEEEEEEEEHKGKEEEHKGNEEVEKESKDDDDVVGEKGGEEEQQLQVNSLFPAAAASGNQLPQQKLEPTAPPYLDPDRASISSASSLEIAVQ